MALAINFTNHSGLSSDDVYLTFGVPAGNPDPLNSPNDFNIAYGPSNTPVTFANKKNMMSEPISLTELGTTGLTVNYAQSVAVYVSYGKKMESTTASPVFIGSGIDYNTQFQTFEITMMGQPGDQGNMTAINYFTAPMKIESFAGTSVLETKSFSKTADKIAEELGALATSAGVLDKGELIRYIGPSSYNSGNPWPSFSPYLKAMNAATQMTYFANQNGFIKNVTTGQKTVPHNIIYRFDLKSTVGSDNSISSTGGTVTVRDGTLGTTLGTFSDCDVIIAGSSQSALDQLIYGQAPYTSDLITWGSGWAKLKAEMIKEFTVPKKGSPGAGYFNTLQATVIGEITSGFLMGMVGSDVLPAGKTVKIKDMQSSDWWTLNPIVAFAQVQPNNAYYNTYANAIYQGSSNESYSIPYSDRLGTGPLVNTVEFNGSDVTSWTVTLEPPISLASG